MARTVQLTVIGVLAMFVGGCDTTTEFADPSSDLASQALISVTVDTPVTSEEGNIPGRWLGYTIDPGFVCEVPDIPGQWSVRHLFDFTPGGSPLDMPLGLRPFCLYEAIGSVPPGT